MTRSILSFARLAIILISFTSIAWAQVALISPTKELPEIIITASKSSIQRAENSITYRPSEMGASAVLQLRASDGLKEQLSDLAIDQGIGVSSVTNGSGGNSSGLSIRGFAVNNQSGTALPSSRSYVDGHSDLLRRFSRDLSTVDRIEVLAGHDATLLGSGAPGGSINYITKKPTGKSFTTAAMGVASNGLYSTLIDSEFSSLAGNTRWVGKVLRQDKTVEGVINAKESFFVTHLYKQGNFKIGLDFERLNDRMPFAFGTVYAGGKFWLDSAYVDPNTAKALRQFERHAITADYFWTAGTTRQNFNFYSQSASAHRDETLLGDWSVTSATTASGYYRRIRDDYQQKERGLRYTIDWGHGRIEHRTILSWRILRENLDFSGPQNIAGFVIDLANPNFSQVDLSKLTLTPRTQLERNQESGLAIAHSVVFPTATTASIGIRRVSNQIDSAINTTALTPVSNTNTTIHSYGLLQKIGSNYKTYLTRSESFEPNRGRQHSGDYLDARRGVQWDAGFRWGDLSSRSAGYLSLFTIDQTNLPAVDPNDKNALIVLGSLRAKGVTLGQKWIANNAGILNGTWTTSLSYLDAGVRTPVSATQGLNLVGAPHHFGSLKWDMPLRNGLQPWLQIVGTSKRPGDAQASFYAPGYVRTDLGAKYAFDKNSSMAFSIQNIADLRYVQALSGTDDVWQGAKRKVFASLEHKF